MTDERAAIMPRLVIEDGARRRLPALVDELGVRRVLLVASERTVRALRSEQLLGACEVEVFSGFRPNPSLEHALAGAAAYRRAVPDLVVAIGGGSALDVGKLARSLPAERALALPMLSAGAPVGMDRRAPLVAMPTTAGTGAEVTRFATVYVAGVKHSLDHPSVAPDYALVDPELLEGCPTPVMHACAFDALCHAVESYWSRRATPESRAIAHEALCELLELLGRGLPPAAADRGRLARAATTAGRAIDITRTTAAHAFSYALTSRFGIAHGVACLLNLLWLLDYNQHPPAGRRPPDAVTAVAGMLSHGACPPTAVRELLRRGGYSDRLRDYGVEHRHVDDLVSAGLESSRSGHNPCRLDRDLVENHLHALV